MMQRPADTEKSILARVLGRHAEKVLRSLPEIREGIAQAEADEVARRAALVEQLRSAPERHERECCAAFSAMVSAREELESAEAAVKVAGEKLRAAQVRQASKSLAYEREVATLRRELVESADPRIELFASSCDTLANELRQLPLDLISIDRDFSSKVSFDASRASAAMAAVTAAAASARALRMQALPAAAVATALESLRAGLIAPLATVDRKPPQIEPTA